MEEIRNIAIQMPIQHHPYSNCIQDIFVTFLLWKEKEFQKLFDHTWSFYYRDGSGFDIDVYRNGFSQIYKSMEQNFGFVKEEISTDDFKNICDKLKSSHPVGACVDTYYCGWHKSCGKYHNDHYIFLNGIQDGAFTCIDPYASKKVERIEKQEFQTVVKECFHLRKTDQNPVQWKQNIMFHLNRILGKDGETSDFLLMKKFADDMLRSEDKLKKEIEKYSNISFWPFLLRLNNIGYGRKCYSIYLEWISKKEDGKLETYAERLEKCAKEWGRVSSLFIKYAVSGYSEQVKKRICDKLYDLSETEEHTARELLEALKQG